MPAPTIYGEPKIRSTDNGSVFLEVVVTGADPSKTKWMLQDKELEQNECYIFSHSDEGGNRKKLICEIKDFDKPLAGEYKAVFYSADGENSATFNDFDKPLAGEYKAVFYSADGENSATFNVTAGNAPDFHDKPHIVQRDNGNVIVIKVRAKSHLEMKAEWFKDDKPVKYSDRIKSVVKKDDKDKDGFQFLLEIHGPQKEDEAKYKCVVKNAEGQNQQSLNLVFD
ncbi:immunoglobulin I-set domain protein [Ancylostoma ceylanicum]|uniref:Immunoglobulin I-set domain protein n=1 Tax=Ancylostoma ceylanicum TaxID=53326 RepID=A0A0D6LIN3_9BILA|nr:immunoglobulin I-set domain protein [Ancylostoma ceylanicum]